MYGMLSVSYALLKCCRLLRPKTTSSYSFRICSCNVIPERHSRPLILHSRRLSSSPRRYYEKDSTSQPSSPISQKVIYNGPLSRTFRSLKIFSLSSLGLAAALTPFMFIIETSLPFVARIALASTALGTSSVSTALVSWCGRPYVSTMRTLTDGNKSDAAETGISGIQLETLTLALRPRYTNVYDTAFLIETQRPFAKWELAKSITLENSNEVTSDMPSEETVAETLDAQGEVLGRWIVFWNDDRTQGRCYGEGKIQRFFNVHEEILPPFIR